MVERGSSNSEINPRDIDPISVMRSMEGNIRRYVGEPDMSKVIDMHSWRGPEGTATYTVMPNEGGVETSVVALTRLGSLGGQLEAKLDHRVGSGGAIMEEYIYFQLISRHKKDLVPHIQDPDRLPRSDRIALSKLGKAIEDHGEGLCGV